MDKNTEQGQVADMKKDGRTQYVDRRIRSTRNNIVACFIAENHQET